MLKINVEYPCTIIIDRYLSKYFTPIGHCGIYDINKKLLNSKDFLDDIMLHFFCDNIEFEYVDGCHGKTITIHIDNFLFYEYLKPSKCTFPIINAVTIDKNTIKYIENISDILEVSLGDLSNCDIIEGAYFLKIHTGKDKYQNPDNYNIICREFRGTYSEKYKNINVLMQTYHEYINRYFISQPLIINMTHESANIEMSQMLDCFENGVCVINMRVKNKEEFEKFINDNSENLRYDVCEEELGLFAIINKNHRMCSEYYGDMCRKYVEMVHTNKIKSARK